MELWFLKAEEPLTKSFTRQADGTYSKTTYPNAFKVTSINSTVENIHDFHTSLAMLAKENMCLLKGPLDAPVVNESRAGRTKSDALTEWVVFDIDGLEGITTPEEFIHDVLPTPFHDASYVAQLSCSSGITGTGLRLHLFFLLDNPNTPECLKRWLTELNLDTPLLANQLKLGAGGMSLRWPLDRSVADNSKLIFIAPPVCTNFADPLAGQRITLVTKSLGRVAFDFPTSQGNVIAAKEREAIERIRADSGLAKRKYSTRREGDYEILKGADPVEVTDWWERNGFIRLNLNGGDSGAYYITPKMTKYIHNFKGEPSLLTKEVAPEFYKELQEKFSKPEMLVFRDPRSDKLYTGKWSPDDDTVEYLYMTANASIKDWAEFEFNAAVPDPIPQYNLIFDPMNPVVVDTVGRTVNWFWPTPYMRLETPEAVEFPATIKRVIHHVVGDDDASFEWFVNWLAFVFKKRDKSGTAIILQGVPGTGKGIVYEHVIRPLFGQYTRELSLDKLEKDLFNSFLDRSLVIHINEAQANEKMRNQLFMWITDHFTSIRKAYQEQQDIRTYCNFVLSSNHRNAQRIEKLDRRFTVCPWQEEPLYTPAQKAAGDPITDIDAIKRELQQFARYLLAYEVDEMLAHTPLENDAKETMRIDSGNSLDDFSNAVNGGNLGYFLELYKMNSGIVVTHSTNVEATLERWAAAVNTGVPTAVTIGELRLIYQYAQQKEVTAPGFPHLLGKIGVRRLTQVETSEGPDRGLMVDWHCDPVLLASSKLKVAVRAPSVSNNPADRTVLSMRGK